MRIIDVKKVESIEEINNSRTIEDKYFIEKMIETNNLKIGKKITDSLVDCTVLFVEANNKTIIVAELNPYSKLYTVGRPYKAVVSEILEETKNEKEQKQRETRDFELAKHEIDLLMEDLQNI